MNMIDKVDQIKKAREEVTLAPKKHRVSDIQSPSAFIAIPSRALNCLLYTSDAADDP